MVLDKNGQPIGSMDPENPFRELEGRFAKVIQNLKDAFQGARCIEPSLMTQAVSDLVKADIFATTQCISNIARIGNKSDEEVQTLGATFAQEYATLLAEELAKDSINRKGTGRDN